MEPVGELNQLMWSTEWWTELFVWTRLDKLGNFLFLIPERVPGKMIGHYEFSAILTELYDIFCFAINDKFYHYISFKCSSRSPILPTILVQSLKVSGTWVMTNTNTKMYVGASNAETRLLHNGVHIFLSRIWLFPFIPSLCVLNKTVDSDKICTHCDNYVPQWWVELDDELSWFFTNRLSATR